MLHKLFRRLYTDHTVMKNAEVLAMKFPVFALENVRQQHITINKCVCTVVYIEDLCILNKSISSINNVVLL